MAESHDSESSEKEPQPGKVRTIWHPLLVRLLSVTLGAAFKVEQEIAVGKMPLRVDILLIRREGGELSEANARDLAELLALLNLFTLIEFKGPTDALEKGDFAQLVGCANLWFSQQFEPVDHSEVSLIVVAPAVNAALRDDLRRLGLEIVERERGIFAVTGLPFAAWIVETDAMAERVQPILSLVSRAFLSDRQGIIDKLAGKGEAALTRCRYVIQQVQQFRKEEDVSMQQTVSQTLEEFDRQLVEKMRQEILGGMTSDELLRGMTPEERLRGLPAEERLRGLPAEERLRGLSVEERLAGLSPEDAARLREILERKQGRAE